MQDFVKLSFGPMAAPEATHTVVVFAGDDLVLPAPTTLLFPAANDLLAAAAKTARFKGKASSSLDLIAPRGVEAARLIVIGIGGEKERGDRDFVALGGAVMGKLAAGSNATIVFDLPFGGRDPAAAAAEFAQGMRLRAYKFDLYKTKKSDDDDKSAAANVTIAVADPSAAKREHRSRDAVAEGVILARNLVNEPPNVLNPEEFARRAAKLEDLGVEVEVLDVKALEKIGMNALLAVGQGSHNESRVVVMRWHGGKGSKGAKPLAFVGKGVCFDTGGISIKPASGMEDMKGDMGGAACVVGLMHALAARKAKVNALGIIGLVENMPDGRSYRPGDILKSLSGQTIEVINTDAEGRLVLADLLWYVQSKYKPVAMIDLATLTGAILVALAQEYAGLFSNDDELAGRIEGAGKSTGEKAWRMPLGKPYDKMIDSKFADMKNTGGRHGGSITAAQFLQRFVNNTPWVHLDVAGTAMGPPANDINQSWGSGWGVRLLDRLVADHYES